MASRGKRPRDEASKGGGGGGGVSKSSRSVPATSAAGPAVPPREVVSALVEGLLPEFGAASVIESKLVNRVVMLDNPAASAGAAGGGGGPGGAAGKSDTSKKSTTRSAPWSKGPRLSRRQMCERGLPRVVHADGCTFRDFVPLHRLWQQYIDELLLPGGGGTGMADKLAKADYHGAMVRVVRSRCPSLVGVSGIVLHETENTVVLMCDDDHERTIPKRNSVFALRHGESLVTVHGSHICFRASERARHKFKPQATVDL